VDDLVHTTFLAAAKSAARYDGRASSRPWLIGISVQLLRRRRQSLARLFNALSSFRSTRAESALDPRPRLQARGDVERALVKLSEAKRVTLLLSEVEGFSGPEVAELLGVPVGTVWRRLHAARQEMRALLQAEEQR
jgi:RNA polymerase sigma-70 factor (ECF subfamily)